MQAKSKAFTFYVLGTVITLFVFCTFIELTTRVVSWGRGNGFTLALHEFDATDDAITGVYEFHPFTGFVFRRNWQIVGSHPRQGHTAEIRTDEHGFLSNTGHLPLIKAANEIRIATIGGSTTANVNLAYEENWPGRVGKFIQERFASSKVTVINAGVPGYDTAQSVANLALRVMPFKPDLVIIYHAYNDLKLVRPGFDIAPDYSNVHQRPYGEFVRPNIFVRILNRSMFYVRARNAYRELKSKQASIQLYMTTDRLDAVPTIAARHFENNIRTLIAISRGGGAQVVLSSFATLHELDVNALRDSLTPMKEQELAALLQFAPGLSLKGLFSGIAHYNRILEDISTEMHTGWVDNANLVPNRDEYFLDRVHFSSQGAEKMADNFRPVVLDRISKTR